MRNSGNMCLSNLQRKKISKVPVRKGIQEKSVSLLKSQTAVQRRLVLREKKRQAVPTSCPNFNSKKRYFYSDFTDVDDITHDIYIYNIVVDNIIVTSPLTNETITCQKKINNMTST